MKKSDYFFIFYYFLLLFVLQMQQSETMPSLALRMGFVIAVMWPLYSVKKELMPVIICLFFTVTNYNFSYSYMPYEVYQYDIMIAVGLFIGYRRSSLINKSLPSILIIMLILVTIINGVTEYKILYITYSIMGIIFLWPFMKYGDAKMLRLMSWGFITAGSVLAINFLLFGRNYLDIYYAGGGFEREGWSDPNYFGCAVGFGIVAALVEIFRRKSSAIIKLILYASIMVMLACLAINASRGALLAVGISSIILISFSRTKTMYKILFTIIIVAGIISIFNMGYFDLLQYRIENDSNGGSGRLIIWTRKIQSFFNEANILNIFFGMGNEGARALAFGSAVSRAFHNDFIAFLCEYGFLGLILYLGWLYYPVKKAKENKLIVASVVGYIAACGLTLEPVTAGRFTYFIFWIYAVQIAVCRNVEIGRK